MKISRVYQKYLRGENLQGQVFTVKIVAVREVEVQPHPTVEKTSKLCLTLQGLPPELPDNLLIGIKNAEILIGLFGDDTERLIGKSIEIRPEQIRVAGVPKIAITIHGAGQAPASSAGQAGRPAGRPGAQPPGRQAPGQAAPPPPPPAPPDDQIPF